MVAEQDGVIVGWVSAYVAPSDPERLFVWQVAVAASARGRGLGLTMLDALATRPACNRTNRLTTTVTRDNRASWALFERFAASRGARLAHAPHFQRDRHFGGAHATEHLVTIAPLKPTGPA